MDTAWIALIGTVSSGVVLKVAESILSKGSKKQDTATEMREELRKESADLKEELRKVDHELDEWKDRYYALFKEYIELKTLLGQEVKLDDKRETDW